MPNDASADPVRDAPAGGALLVVSTPIGNLADITERAVRTLRDADLVLCEDTRHSRRLLDAIGAKSRVAALHGHNEARETPRLIARMLAGERMALISDAGTPLVSDPGARLVRACAEAGVAVVPVPGASALLGAVVASALVDGPFTFQGFLPRKGKARQDLLAAASASPCPSVIFEAGNRVRTTLTDLAEACGSDRRAAVCRELTKRYEETRRGTVSELAAYYGEAQPRGEVVLVIAGADPRASGVTTDASRALAVEWHTEGRSTRDVARALMDVCGLSRNAAYALAREVAETREAPDS